MQSFLKEQKILTEIAKGVATMKQFVYPSVLQVCSPHFALTHMYSRKRQSQC